MASPEDFAKFLRKASGGFAITKSDTLNDTFVNNTSRFATADEMLSECGIHDVSEFFVNPPSDEFFVANTQFDTFEQWLNAAKLAAGKDRIRQERVGD